MERLATRRYRFGVFEADTSTGELRRQGLRVRIHAQPFQVLVLLLERQGEVVTREEISRELWPEGTFVDYEHGVNSAVNRVREALGDKAGSPRFVETLARRGYRFVAPVERVDSEADTAPATPTQPAAPAQVPAPAMPEAAEERSFFDAVLAQPEDLPRDSHRVARSLFLALQLMYLGFYVGALANLAEIGDLLSPLGFAHQAFWIVVATAALMIPVRIFVICAMLFRAPRARAKLLALWPLLLVADLLWALSPALLLHHINLGVAIACMPLLVYSPFAQRSLILMGAAE